MGESSKGISPLQTIQSDFDLNFFTIPVNDNKPILRVKNFANLNSSQNNFHKTPEKDLTLEKNDIAKDGDAISLSSDDTKVTPIKKKPNRKGRTSSENDKTAKTKKKGGRKAIIAPSPAPTPRKRGINKTPLKHKYHKISEYFQKSKVDRKYSIHGEIVGVVVGTHRNLIYNEFQAQQYLRLIQKLVQHQQQTTTTTTK